MTVKCLTEQQRNELCRLASSGKFKTLTELSEATGVNYFTMRKMLIEEGVHLVKKQGLRNAYKQRQTVKPTSFTQVESTSKQTPQFDSLNAKQLELAIDEIKIDEDKIIKSLAIIPAAQLVGILNKVQTSRKVLQGVVNASNNTRSPSNAVSP